MLNVTLNTYSCYGHPSGLPGCAGEEALALEASLNPRSVGRPVSPSGGARSRSSDFPAMELTEAFTMSLPFQSML